MQQDTWRPCFWKLSHGKAQFTKQQMLEAIESRLVYVYYDTPPKGGAAEAQGSMFMKAPIGDYFYLTHGNQGIYLLGQFSGPANIFSARKEGWADRPFRLIRFVERISPYKRPKKWWTPNENSTFIRVPDDEIGLFEELILGPHFGIRLKDFGIDLP